VGSVSRAAGDLNLNGIATMRRIRIKKRQRVALDFTLSLTLIPGVRGAMEVARFRHGGIIRSWDELKTDRGQAL